MGLLARGPRDVKRPNRGEDLRSEREHGWILPAVLPGSSFRRISLGLVTGPGSGVLARYRQSALQ